MRCLVSCMIQAFFSYRGCDQEAHRGRGEALAGFYTAVELSSLGYRLNLDEEERSSPRRGFGLLDVQLQ